MTEAIPFVELSNLLLGGGSSGLIVGVVMWMKIKENKKDIIYNKDDITELKKIDATLCEIKQDISFIKGAIDKGQPKT